VNVDGAVTAGVVLPFLMVAHHVADHWVQTHHQARTKALPGWEGRWACAKHVATYTAVTAGTVLGLWIVFGLHISTLGFLIGQAVSAVTHYWTDRGSPLRWLAHSLGKGGFYDLGQPRKVTAWAQLGATPAAGVRPVHLHESGTAETPGWDNPSLGTGAYALDQSWHLGWLAVAAIVTAVL
jgi:hypothetical protein